MSELEKEILAALVELDHAAKAMRTAEPKPDLQTLFARLDELTGQLPKDSDPNLVHYLRSKSYQKARHWLQRQEAGQKDSRSLMS